MKPKIDIKDKFAGLMLGGAVGDAIGLPREAMSKRRSLRLFGQAPLHHKLFFGRGMFSDDTEHAYLTALALLRSSDDPARFAKKLARRFRLWFLCLPAGVGMGTAKACLKLLVGIPAKYSGVYSAGNGPAMKAPVIGAYYHDKPELLGEMVTICTRMTHTDPKAVEGAWVIAKAAAYAVEKTPEALDVEEFFSEILPHLKGEELVESCRTILELLQKNASAEEMAATMNWQRGISGYINHTVPAVLFCWLRYKGDFRQTVEQTVLLGGDTDTTGAIVGGLAGLSSGLKAIPEKWINGLWEWPCSAKWLQRLATCLAEKNTDPSKSIRIPKVWWPAVLIRNILFLLVVLTHGFRRLFPPY